MYKDFNIDIDYDIVYKLIEQAGGRTLSDLYLTDNNLMFPVDVLGEGEDFYGRMHRDYFWLLSYQEAINLFDGLTPDSCEDREWPKSSPDIYWLRSPDPNISYGTLYVSKEDGNLHFGNIVSYGNYAARPVFTIAFKDIV